jgi:uncharacterized repeat protein (TIGR01451 family)
MAAPSIRTIKVGVAVVAVAVIGVLAFAAAYGQERSQYAPVTPTLTERLGRMRNNLFGTGEPDQANDLRANSARTQRVENPNVAQPAGAARRGPLVVPGSRHGVSARSYSGTAAMSGRPPASRNPGESQSPAAEPTDHNALPSLARRPQVSTTRAASPAAAAASPSAPLSSRRSLQERLAANRDQNQEPSSISAAEPGAGQEATTTHDSARRDNPFVVGNSPTGVQEIINPTIARAENAKSDSGSLDRAPRPPVVGAASPATEPPGNSSINSSRRGFSNDSPSDRVASIMPARDRLPAADATGDGVLFKRQSPLVSIETAGPRTIVIGKEATYTVHVRNAGDVAAQDVAVTIRIPEWAEVVASKATSGVGQVPHRADEIDATGGVAANAGLQTVEWTLPRLEANGKEHLSLQIVPRQSRPFDLAVQWTFTPITSTTVVQVQEPKLTMSLSGPADVLFGDTKIYKMTLANPGTGDAENVVIHLSPLTGQAGSPTRHQIGTIRAGDNKVIEVELTARQSGKLVIHAAAAADGGLQAEISEEITVRRAALEMKVVGGKVRYAGTVAAYQIELANSGTAPAENVQVVAALPPGAKLVAATNGGQASADGAKVNWTIPTVRAGDNTVLELKCQMNNPGANRLSVQSTAGDLSASAEETTQVEALADLKLDVVEPKGPIAVGADVTYEVRLLNRGTKSASDVKVVGYFSGRIEPISATGGEHRLVPGIVVFKPIASLAPGNEASFKITARARAPGNHMFKAEVVCEAAGAKLGSEHTTLFYGDEITTENAAEEQTTDNSPRPLAPTTMFAPDDRDASEAEPAPQSQRAPAFKSQRAPVFQSQRTPLIQSEATPALQRAVPTQLGSAYAPAASTAPSGATSGSAGKSAVPVSPFALRPRTVK